jgi:hypothetical protein
MRETGDVEISSFTLSLKERIEVMELKVVRLFREADE